jgi:hypothetical protein
MSVDAHANGLTKLPGDVLKILDEWRFICPDGEIAGAIAKTTDIGLSAEVWPSGRGRLSRMPDIEGWKVIVVSGTDETARGWSRRTRKECLKRGAVATRDFPLFGLGREFPTFAAWIDHHDLAKTIAIQEPWLEERSEPLEEEAPSADGEAKDSRPIIFVTTEEADVNDSAIDALKADEGVYQRNFRLISVARDSKPKGMVDIKRAEGTPVIRSIQPPRLREILTRNIRWKKASSDHDGKPVVAKTHPPAWCVNAILAREEWPDIRYLVGVVEAPTLRADGSVIESAGYDARTGLLYVPNGSFPALPQNPTQDDATVAAKFLLGLVKDFPFKEGHEAAWLAALLTPLARFLIDGPVPLFLFEANTSGAGKTLLCDIIAIVNTGRPMTRTGYYHDPVEMDKQIVATALSGDRIVLFDNLDNGGKLGNSALDRALTGRTYRGRVLGKSEMTPDLDLNCVFFGTGNNLSLCGDVVRRIILSRLESLMERPEERSDFAIKDLIGHATEDRGRLVVAALTILRAYILAGKPDQGLTAMDFTAWSGLIRNAVHWSTGIDPAAGRKDLSESTPDRQHEAAFVEGWFEVQDLLDPDGMTSATLLKRLKGADLDRFTTLRDALADMWPRTKPGELPSSGSIGMKIHAMRGKSHGGKHFEHVTTDRDSKVWKVVCGTVGTKRTILPPTRKKGGDITANCNVGSQYVTPQNRETIGNSPSSPDSPATHSPRSNMDLIMDTVSARQGTPIVEVDGGRVTGGKSIVNGIVPGHVEMEDAF